MTSKVTNDFKAAFALLLTIMKVNYTTTTAMNYSQTVYEWTLAGLITEGILVQEFSGNTCKLTDRVPGKNYAATFMYAEKKYAEAVQLIKTPVGNTLKSYAQSEILAKCFDINKAIFPIALAEGLLDLKDIAAGIGSQAGNIPTERDR